MRRLHRTGESETLTGFDDRVSDELIDLLANPPASWSPAAPAPAPEAPKADRARAKRLSRQPWNHTAPYRVHFYDAKKRGTWIQYFEDRPQAEAFAVGKSLWAEPASVEQKPRSRS